MIATLLLALGLPAVATAAWTYATSDTYIRNERRNQENR
jgi:hypothetical protein